MADTNTKLNFECDYLRGAHENIIRRLAETNMMETDGYGLDPVCDSARERIREACGCPDAKIEFLVGGTQANAVIIDAFLRPAEGVIAADFGHISVHEAGAIEAGGHKVLALPHGSGKISAAAVRKYIEDYYDDFTHDHMVRPAMVYISQPTELGTLYSLDELKALRKVCDDYDIALYADGARLAYALACPENDVTLPDLAELCDAFYIGGTKCGALLGEAVVVPNPDRLPYLFSIIKQHGALLAKGRLLGIQFDELFKDDLYMRIGKPAIEAANRIREALREKGYELYFESPTNQVLCIIENDKLEKLCENVVYPFWGKYDDDHTVIRFATDWATEPEKVDRLIEVL